MKVCYIIDLYMHW